MPLKSDSNKTKDAAKPSPEVSTPIQTPFTPTTIPAEFLQPGANPLLSNLRMLRITGNSSLIGKISTAGGKKSFTVEAATFNEDTPSPILAPLDKVSLPITGEPPTVDLNNAALITAWKKGEAFAIKLDKENRKQQKKGADTMPSTLHLEGLSQISFAGNELEYIELANPKNKKDDQTYLGHIVNSRLIDIEGALFVEKTKDGDKVAVPSMFPRTVTLNIDGRSEVPYDYHDGKVDRNDPALKAAYEKAKSSITESMREAELAKFMEGLKFPTIRPEKGGPETTLFPSADVSIVDLAALVPDQAEAPLPTPAKGKKR